MASCSQKVFTPYDCLLISVAYVVLCRVDCLWVTGVPVAVAWWFYGRDEKRSDAAARLIGPASLRERRHCNGQIRYKVYLYGFVPVSLVIPIRMLASVLKN